MTILVRNEEDAILAIKAIRLYIVFATIGFSSAVCFVTYLACLAATGTKPIWGIILGLLASCLTLLWGDAMTDSINSLKTLKKEIERYRRLKEFS